MDATVAAPEDLFAPYVRDPSSNNVAESNRARELSKKHIYTPLPLDARLARSS